MSNETIKIKTPPICTLMDKKIIAYISLATGLICRFMLLSCVLPVECSQVYMYVCAPLLVASSAVVNPYCVWSGGGGGGGTLHVCELF